MIRNVIYTVQPEERIRITDYRNLKNPLQLEPNLAVDGKSLKLSA